MTEHTSQSDEEKRSGSQKKPYHSPHLVLYGNIRDLTRTGNPSVVFDNPSPNPMSK